jgi:hypothetical protein
MKKVKTKHHEKEHQAVILETLEKSSIHEEMPVVDSIEATFSEDFFSTERIRALIDEVYKDFPSD